MRVNISCKCDLELTSRFELRGHKRSGTYYFVKLRVSLSLPYQTYAKVGKPDFVSISSEEHVRWLHISVDDACSMRRLKCRCQLQRHLQGCLDVFLVKRNATGVGETSARCDGHYKILPLNFAFRVLER